MDVSAGENKAIDIAAKYDDQVECYGWSNETYMYGWKNYRRKINEGDYFVRVIVTSGGKKIKGWFKLKNDLPQTRFHLYYLSHEERNRIKEFKDEPEIWIDI
jgi:hypothetical protein